MSNETTRTRLYEMMLNIRETLTELIACINYGRPYTEDELPYGYEWQDETTLVNINGDEVEPDTVRRVNWHDPHEYLTDYPLEIIDERGRNFAVVLTVGGPHIEIAADGQNIASLHGYWGGEHVTLSGQVFDAVLDYFIER